MVHIYNILEDKYGPYIALTRDGSKKRRLKTYIKWLEADGVHYEIVKNEKDYYIYVKNG